MRVATSKTADFHTNYLDSKPSAIDFLIFYDTLIVRPNNWRSHQ